MATKLMQSQNLTQADLIANETAEERSTRAGQSTVTITSTNGKMARNQRWYDVASDAACEAFDVQVYSEAGADSLDEVFYGLADNTVAAALAFEMLHNQIETWALERKGELRGRTAGINYRLGVAQRVLEDAEKENRRALRQAQEAGKKRLREEAAAEEAARAAEIARLANPADAEPVTTSPIEEPNVSVKVEDVPEEQERKPLADLSDEENEPLPSYAEGAVMYDDFGDTRADFDLNDEVADHQLDLDELESKVQVKPEPAEPSLRTRGRSRLPPPPPAAPAVKAETEPVKLEHELPSIMPESSDEAPSWTSALQLRTFRDNAKTIAENYLKDTGTKVRKGPKLREIKYDHAAFTKGWNDGRKVDLKRRRIEGEEKIKKER
ncbi:putative protein of unknown function (DUF2786) [Lyophyllum shimeji]|uniref:DUF7168 domain-containing protein n=1 Tax=Lyophyllum shimeji TaxID=47721 RepID=A0A9P3PZN4_LYOSH|nr:putative protein of unknown function (DUF2786) [Lyophyllum shimeji]